MSALVFRGVLGAISEFAFREFFCGAPGAPISLETSPQIALDLRHGPFMGMFIVHLSKRLFYPQDPPACSQS